MEDYTADSIQCFSCLKFGHISTSCIGKVSCVHCGTIGHRKSDNACGSKPKRCANCKGPHPANYRGCVEFLREKEAQKIRAKDKKPLHDARIIARDKHFPHLSNRVGSSTSQEPQTTGSRGYAAAARGHQERSRQEVAPLQTSEPTSVTSPTTNSSNTQRQGETQVTTSLQEVCIKVHMQTYT